jgi:lysyl-tRNA synthetase class 2
MKTLNQIRGERIKKIEALVKQGKNPYPSICCKRIDIAQAREKMNEQVEVVGKIFSLRGHGGLIFADLKDVSGKIQLMFKADVIKPEIFENLKLLDVGDYLYVAGTVTKSVRGEISILVDDFQFLAKSVRPLPEKWHGLKDVEERYRQRYVDLLVNPGVKEIFLTRSKVIDLLREHLNKRGFIEVETPVLQPIYGGASANPFITHHSALDIDLYLRIADELYLKRLIVAGFEKVYEIGKDFRNEGFSRVHNPEFTQLEFYWAYVDYNFLMDETEKMVSDIVRKIKGGYKVTYQGKEYDFTLPWPRIPFSNLVLKYAHIDINVINDEEKLVKEINKRKLLPGEKLVGYGQILDSLYKKYVRPHLDGPIFVTDHPVEMRPLAKRKEDDPTKAASFQLLVAGEEFLNAYNELNDPQDQRNRWVREMELGQKGAEDFQVLDEDYIRALEYGMPPTAGWGMGIDRFVAFLTDQHSIKDVILFPTLRPVK